MAKNRKSRALSGRNSSSSAVVTGLTQQIGSGVAGVRGPGSSSGFDAVVSPTARSKLRWSWQPPWSVCSVLGH